MALYCEKCKNEILRYLKTGELKELKRKRILSTKTKKGDEIFTEKTELISYQCYFCVHCKIVYLIEHEKFEVITLKENNNADPK